MSEQGPQGGGFVIPQYSESELPWSYFLLKAANRSPRVAYWAESAVIACTARRLGCAEADITEDEIERVLQYQPESPVPFLRGLFLLKDQSLPGRDEPLTFGAQIPTSIQMMSQDDLLRDAAIIVQADFSVDGFHALIDAVQDDDQRDPRAAIALVMYCMMLLAS